MIRIENDKGRIVLENKSIPLEIHIRHIGVESMTIVSKLSFLFVLSGNLSLLHNGKLISIREGDIYIINKNDIVSVPNMTDNMVMTSHLWAEGQFKLNHPLSLVYMTEAYEKISSCLSQAMSEYIKKEEGFKEVLLGYHHQLLGYLYRYLPQIKGTQDTTHIQLSDKITELVDYILKNFEKKITLDDLSDRFFISKFYLAHTFKEEVGLSVGQFIKQVRLTHSLELLYHQTYSLDDIAIKSGFPSTRAFRDAFKEKYEVTPAQYRIIHTDNSNEELSFELSEQEVYQLISKYTQADTVNHVVGNSYEVISEVIDTGLSMHTEHFYLEGIAKLDIMSKSNMLPNIKQDLGMKYVAITHPLRKIQAVYRKDSWDIQLYHLYTELNLVISNGLYPYIQIGIEDFDDFQEMFDLPEIAWIRLFDTLNQQISQRFMDTSQWYIEYRCFYENVNGGELCLPLVRLIQDTSHMYQVIIHLPELPVTHQEIEQPVMVIDDRSRVRTYDLADILKRLHHMEHLEKIAENKNILFQQLALNHFIHLEEDEHYRPLISLITANQTLWFFNIKLDNLSTHFLQPISIDGTSLYTYFPKELSQKLALMSEAGVYHDMWYAYQFKTSLYEEVIYQTEFFILTRQGEDYRLLAIYPEKKITNLETISTEMIKQQPFMLLDIKLLSLTGKYKKTVKELSPYTKMEHAQSITWMNDVNLSQEDIDYINGLSRPKRQVEVISTNDILNLNIQIPILGMVYIDLKKIK